MHEWDELLAGRRDHARRDGPAVGPRHVHLHRRHDGPVEGLHAQPQLPRGARPPDRHLLGAHRRRRGVDAAAAVPLQRARHRRARLARVRRPRRDLPPVLGVELLAGDEPRRRDHHLDARHDGVPARPRRRPARDAEVGRARGEHDRCGCSARRRCPVEVDNRIRERFGVETFSGAFGADRGQPRLVAAARRAQQAQRGRRAQRRVLRRPPLRRRREGSAAGRERRDRRPAEASARDVRGLLGSARRRPSKRPATLVPHRRHRRGSTTTASCSSSTARPTTSAGAARTSRASRSRAC